MTKYTGLTDSGTQYTPERKYLTYQTFTLQDHKRDEPLLVKVDYLDEMFDLEVQNEQGKPIVITLRERVG